MKNGTTHTIMIASVLSIKNRKKNAPTNWVNVVMNEGMLSVAKLTTSLTSRSNLFVRLPVWNVLSVAHCPCNNLVNMCWRMRFWAFTPSIALIQRDERLVSMRSSMIVPISTNAWLSVHACVWCVAASTANFVAHTNARSRETSSTPTIVLSVACNLYPLSCVSK